LAPKARADGEQGHEKGEDSQDDRSLNRRDRLDHLWGRRLGIQPPPPQEHEIERVDLRVHLAMNDLQEVGERHHQQGTGDQPLFYRIEGTVKALASRGFGRDREPVRRVHRLLLSSW
jgi:hypothetical protein